MTDDRGAREVEADVLRSLFKRILVVLVITVVLPCWTLISWLGYSELERRGRIETNQHILEYVALTGDQLDCAFKVARDHPGLAQVDPQGNFKLIDACVDARARLRKGV